jgi:2-polyprenyl-6-methoxyphenol hydroxylase-like FAD-dependent oxidoreductase
MQQPKVLICGAGPTGLVLALWLTKAGVPVRIIDKSTGPGTTSRATVVHARTLELYRIMGIEGAAASEGIYMEQGRLWVGGKQVASLPFGLPGKSITPFPYVLVLPQDIHEQLLVEELAKLGVHVERETTLLSFEETEDAVRVHLVNAAGEESTCSAAYLAGCDGAHSAVRRGLGIGFPGGTYEGMFYVADLRIKGKLANGDLNAAFDEADFLLVFPMKGEGRVRLIGRLREEISDKRELQWSDVSDRMIAQLKMEVEEVYWFSSYHVHHRVADHFRKGRAFLLGDAGHIHSPVGGQGMNTGIGDAINLAWKLAAVLSDGAPDALLETYEPEHIAFARNLVATTDRAFTFIDKRSALATFIRTRIVPPLVHVAFKLNAVRTAAFLTVSQTRISYDNSPLNEGSAGKLRSGGRLPWIQQGISQTSDCDNYVPLTCLCWQVHCYGTPPPDVKALCTARSILLSVFPFDEIARKAGVLKDALYVVRPDAYIALALPNADATKLKSYLEKWLIGKAGGLACE